MQETSCHKSKVIKRRIYCFSWHLHFSYKKKSGSINFERNKIFDQKKRAMSQKDKTKLRNEIHNSETSTISRKIIQKWKPSQFTSHTSFITHHITSHSHHNQPSQFTITNHNSQSQITIQLSQFKKHNSTKFKHHNIIVILL